MTSILISLMDQTESGQLSKDARPFSVGRRLVLEYVSRLPLRLPQSIATVCWILVVRVSRLNGVPGIVRGGLTRGARLTRRTKVPNGFAGTMKSAPGSSGSNFVCPHSIADIRILHGAAHVPRDEPVFSATFSCHAQFDTLSTTGAVPSGFAGFHRPDDDATWHSPHAHCHQGGQAGFGAGKAPAQRFPASSSRLASVGQCLRASFQIRGLRGSGRRKQRRDPR